MTVDLAKFVEDMIARNLARVRARNQRMQQLADARAERALPQAAATSAKTASPKRMRREPKPPPSQPQCGVVTMLTRSEHMALVRIAYELGLPPGEALRWAWQAYSEVFDERRGWR